MEPNPLISAALRREFGQWSKEIVSRISAQSRLVRIRKGEVLARAGEDCQGVWMVLTGSIRVLHQHAGGRHFTNNYLEPGHLIGLIPMFDGKGMLADYLAHEDSTLAVIPAHVLQDAVLRDAKVAAGLLTLLSQRVRMLHLMLEQHSLLSPSRRLAARLLALSTLFGSRTKEGMAIALKMSQNDLAVLVGVTRPTINKEIHALVEARIVKKLAYSRLLILDLPALQRLAEGR